MNSIQLSKPKPPLYQITTLEQTYSEPNVIQLIYGPSGAGKTWYCGTAGPELFFINTGQGEETLKSPYFRHLFPDAGKMAYVSISEKMNAQGKIEKAEAFDMLCDVIDDFFNQKNTEQFKHVKTIVVDDATFMRRFAMNRGMEANTALRKNPTEERKDALNKWIPEGVDDYKQEMGAIEWFLAQHIPLFRDAKLNFILTAHQRESFGKPAVIGEEGALLKVRPGFTGKTFPDQIPAYFDEVWRFDSMKGGETGSIHRAITVGDEVHIGKTRHAGVFPDVIVNPNFKTVLAMVQEGKIHPSFLKKITR